MTGVWPLLSKYTLHFFYYWFFFHVGKQMSSLSPCMNSVTHIRVYRLNIFLRTCQMNGGYLSLSLITLSNDSLMVGRVLIHSLTNCGGVGKGVVGGRISGISAPSQGEPQPASDVMFILAPQPLTCPSAGKTWGKWPETLTCSPGPRHLNSCQSPHSFLM